MADYFVNPATGNDGNSGLDPTTNAWATTQKALDTCIAGDTCGFVTGTTETTAVQIDADTNAGTGAGIIKFYACNSSGVQHFDDTRYTIQASASISNLILYTSGSMYVYWYNFDFDGNSNATDILDHSGVSAGANTNYYNCEIQNSNGGYGATIRGADITFEKCLVHDNLVGIRPAAAIQSRGEHIHITYCRIYDNTSHGVDNLADHTITMVGNQIYGNGGDGVLVSAAGSDGYPMIFDRNVFFGNTGDGLGLTVARFNNTQITNNSMDSNGGYGLNITAAIADDSAITDYNQYHNNTSGHCAAVSDVNINDGTVGGNNVVGDPSFTNETAGSEDFTPQSGSILIRAGINNCNIGALAHLDGGGGSGVFIPVTRRHNV